MPRHPNLVRLTGRHPFNCEPLLPDLMKAGFITPPQLHYVRNHGAPHPLCCLASTSAVRPLCATLAGAVPKCHWDTHKLSIDGLVEKPTTFSMDDLYAMPSREIPVTLVCAGNRRKEENLVKQTVAPRS